MRRDDATPRPGFPFTSAVLQWVRWFAGDPIAHDGILWVPTPEVRWGVRPAAAPGWWAVMRSERDGEPEETMRGLAGFAERYLVWQEAAAAQWTLQRRRSENPRAPWRVAAPSGPLAVLGSEVAADGSPVAVFADQDEAFEFTHYGYVPAGILIEQVMARAPETLFLAGSRLRALEEQQLEAERIRGDVAALLAARARPAEERRQSELRAILGSPTAALARTVRRRLRYFSLVMPRPKEGEGDSLQVAFRVADDADEQGLLAALRLASRQDPVATQLIGRPGAALEVTVETGGSWTLPDVDSLTERLVVLRVWNRSAMYEVTSELIDHVAAVEAWFDELGIADRGRETGLLGFVSPERYPEVFDGAA